MKDDIRVDSKQMGVNVESSSDFSTDRIDGITCESGAKLLV